MAVVTSIAAVMKVDSCGSGESLRPRLVGWLVGWLVGGGAAVASGAKWSGRLVIVR